jgi:hypothetical protein
MDRAVTMAREAAPAFAALGIGERISLLRSLQRGILSVAPAIVGSSCRAKGIEAGSPLEGEEWATGPYAVMRQLRLLRESLGSLEERGATPLGPFSRTADGRSSVSIFPMNVLDGLFFRNVSVTVRMSEGLTEEQVKEMAAPFYRGRGHDGRVALILGAGNIASIPLMDVLTKLFNEGKVCLLKMSPVNEYLGPLIERAFGEAVRKGYLGILYGGAEEGSYLCRHAGVDEIHITGSDRTHDSILWGEGGGEGRERRRSGEPLLGKEITSELGNVSPVIIVPGPYREKEQHFQAEGLVGAATANASYLCNAARILVTPRGWPGRVPFIRNIEGVLAHVPTRKAFYPGSEERWNQLTSGRHRLRTFGGSGGGRLPWALATWLDPDDEGEDLFREEMFCPILGETSVGTEDPLDFLEKAVDFVNGRLWGTLSATLIVHPASLADPAIGAAVEEAIARLRYGTVSINSFPGVSYALGSPPWGGYPGSGPRDIQSGSGWVHNTSMLEGVEKVVCRHPLMTYPKPPYFPGHRGGRRLMRRMTWLEKDYSWARVPGAVLSSLRV